MTTLAANKPRSYEGGSRNAFGLVAASKFYEGAALGVVAATGLVRALVAGDKFVGFAEEGADNSSGAAAAINGRVIESGKISLPVSGAVITDVGAAVYASDDDTFSFSPVGGSFIGFVHRFESAGIVTVKFDASAYRDPFEGFLAVLKSANYTVTAADTGKVLCVDTDAVVITLPAVEGINNVRVLNLGAYGAVGVSVSPAAADMIEGPGITAADDKDIINTKATANRQDWIEISNGDANGWSSKFKGVWAREA